MQGTQVRSLGREDPLEEEMATHSGILAGKSHGHSSLVGYSPRGLKELGTTRWLNSSNTGKDADQESMWRSVSILFEKQINHHIPIIFSISKKETPLKFKWITIWSQTQALFLNANHRPDKERHKHPQGNESGGMPFSGTCRQGTRSLVGQTYKQLVNQNPECWAVMMGVVRLLTEASKRNWNPNLGSWGG